MELPRVSLALLPTPIHRLDRASQKLGIDLWIKRDDLTGLALGGNKARKLEFLIADALIQGADTIVTCGALQSNFIRQLGAACAANRLKCTAAVMALPYEDVKPQGIELDQWQGNPRLDHLWDVDLHRFPDNTWEVLFSHAAKLAADLGKQGHRVYQVPIGGSSPLGAFAFTVAANEIKESGHTFDWIVAASSSGSTQTGLTYGFRESLTRVIGIAADPEPEFKDDLVNLGKDLARLLQTEALGPDSFLLDLRFCGSGYGVTDVETLEAIRSLARLEGILLDPIYSGKAYRGLVQLAAEGVVQGKVLFWHTGGIPSFFGVPD